MTVRASLSALLALTLPALTLPLLTGCGHLPQTTTPRPALSMPADVESRYALPAAVSEVSLVSVSSEPHLEIYRGELACGAERARFNYLRPAQTEGELPFVLCLPILAGGRELMWFVATSLAERGYAVAWAERVASMLKPGQRTAELEQLVRRSVIHNRMVLTWIRRQDNIDRHRTGCLGISLGGILGTIVLAVEPDLRGGCLCLAGGDMPSLAMTSTERRARRWRDWRRKADGTVGDELIRELSLGLVSDPARLGPYIPTEKVLMVGGTFDNVVPRRNQDVLWESLGRPERRSLPLGHYTSALAFSSIMGSVDTFMQQRFAAAASVPLLADDG